tara:strand:- start:22107 stop:22451 length:345 start_codon:yes stop_codon:yes gene_type:complete
MNKLIIACLLFFAGQSAIWFQTNGQFVWPIFKRNPIAVSIIFGTTISYILIYGSKHMVEYYNGLLWPGRFIGFGLGMISFTFLTWYFLDEGINAKTIISLLISIILIAIQILWK